MAMVDNAELKRLLSLVRDAESSADDGLVRIRFLLARDSDGNVLRFLKREIRRIKGKRVARIAFALAEHYRKKGDVKSLRRLFATDDARVRESILNALWGAPGPNPEMGPTIVQMAIGAADDPSPDVRTEVCFMLMNQCANGCDVTAGLAPLRSLLADPAASVRRQAAYAVGHFAKKKHDMAACVRQLRHNVKHKSPDVRVASGWALWQLSRHKHNIGTAAAELVWLLGDERDAARKNASVALIHHAKKSAESANDIRKRIRLARLNEEFKVVAKLVNELARLD